MSKKTAIIIGAGPAGLTAAYELAYKTNIKPIIFEMSGNIGGIAKTINYKGNRLDIGPHRFFSKSDKVVAWWLNILPLFGNKEPSELEEHDRWMLVCRRVTRILFANKFFDYPLSLSFKTLINLGFIRLVKIAFSYTKIYLFPIKNEKTLEDFFINRFGKELYLIFFKDYTQKIWGISCNQIQADWGIQRVKGLSVVAAIKHALKKLVVFGDFSILQGKSETSLIDKFMYPKLGAGQLWEEVARQIQQKGGEICLKHKVISIKHQNNSIVEIIVRNEISGKTLSVKGDYFLSTMPVKDLMRAFGEGLPSDASQVAEALEYRDFIIVGLLAKKLKMNKFHDHKDLNRLIPDNWIYIQESNVKLGRLDIFNNWSPFMVKDRNTVWLGLEYFCRKGDHLWNQSDEDLIKLGISELVKINFIEKEDVLDATVERVLKAYPAYFGGYNKFSTIRDFTDTFENLFLIGRNGMHRYNNMDHSMLTAMTAVENIIQGIETKDNIWAINIEQQYHEKKGMV